MDLSISELCWQELIRIPRDVQPSTHWPEAFWPNPSIALERSRLASVVSREKEPRSVESAFS